MYSRRVFFNKTAILAAIVSFCKLTERTLFAEKDKHLLLEFKTIFPHKMSKQEYDEKRKLFLTKKEELEFIYSYMKESGLILDSSSEFRDTYSLSKIIFSGTVAYNCYVYLTKTLIKPFRKNVFDQLGFKQVDTKFFLDKEKQIKHLDLAKFPQESIKKPFYV